MYNCIHIPQLLVPSTYSADHFRSEDIEILMKVVGAKSITCA